MVTARKNRLSAEGRLIAEGQSIVLEWQKTDANREQSDECNGRNHQCLADWPHGAWSVHCRVVDSI